MNGQALYNLLTNILGGETLDPTYALTLFNLARLDLEGRRPWRVLRAKDTTQIASAGQNFSTPYAMPTPVTPSLASPYLMEFLLEGSIRLVSSVNPNQIVMLKEVGFEDQLDYQGQNFFYSDYANRQFYILANLPSAFTINQFFIGDFGDITLATTWLGFPARFAPALAYQAAARYRLGTDYDDISARNADDNSRTSEMIYKAMMTWDSRMSQQIAGNRSMGGVYGGNNGTGYFPPPGASSPYGAA